MGHDAVVIGGGLAGIVAARRMQQAGAHPVLLEKSSLVGGMGNARISGGLIHLAWRALDEAPELLFEKILAVTDGEADPALARVVADNAGRCLAWLQAEGVDLRPKDPAIPYQRHALFPHRPGTGRRIAAEYGPDKMISRLWASYLDAGGEVRLGCAGRSLEGPSEGLWRVVGATDTGTERFEAPSVLVADGGFQANAEMLSRYVGPNAGLSCLRAMTSSTGDGLSMLLEQGAKALGLGRVYGHIVSRDALANDELWPYPSMDKLALDGAILDRLGAPLAARASDGVELVTLLARSENPRGHVVVFDEELWQSAGRDNPYNTAVPNPDLIARGATLHCAPSLEALASQLGVEVTRFLATLAAHNADPTRVAIGQPPFYAAPIVPGITFTMGGVAIDPSAVVLDRSERRLEGLHAAGSTVGGLQGGPRGGYVGGLAVALVLGIIAAETMLSRC